MGSVRALRVRPANVCKASDSYRGTQELNQSINRLKLSNSETQDAHKRNTFTISEVPTYSYSALKART